MEGYELRLSDSIAQPFPSVVSSRMMGVLHGSRRCFKF